MGKIIVITGPMFSGKSTEILRILERYCLAKKAVSYFVPESDTRTTGRVLVSSARRNYSILVEKLPCDLSQTPPFTADVIAFDEVQFFNPRIITFCQELKDADKTVVASGLDMDYLRRPFGSIGDLMAIADEVKKLTAICSICGNEAIYTKRISSKKEQVLIGDNHYAPRCKDCYRKE